MAVLSNYLQNQLLDFLFRGQPFSPPSTLYIALFTTAPGPGGGGIEVSGGNYARIPVPSTLVSWSGTQGALTTAPSTGTSGEISNNNMINFNGPTADWGFIVDVALFDSIIGGNLWLFGMLNGAPIHIQAGASAPQFNQSQLVMGLV